jgi:glycosyltransferase involved in cell wall biosynthesis
MKILHVIPSLSQVHGGPTNALLLMERALAALGISIETATTDDEGHGLHNGKVLGQALVENGAVHWYFRKATEFYKVSPAFANWIASEVRRFDVVHIHALFSFTSVVTAWAARRAGVPYVIRPLGTLNEYGREKRRRLLKAASLRFVEGPMLRRAAAVHFTSEQESVEASALGIEMRKVVIPLGIEPTTAHDERADSRFAQLHGAPCVLFLSRLDPKKNVEGLLEATALLKQRWPALRLLVAGDGARSYTAALHSHALSLGLEENVVWAGHLEGESKDDAFAAADVFALPSFSENFGIAAAEALAAGLPCVLGRGVAIAADVVQANAGIAVNPNAKEIADALGRIIASQADRDIMATNAKRLAHERFSSEAMGASLKQLYLDILHPR